MTSNISVQIALAPKGWTAKDVVRTLQRDPYQTRTSIGGEKIFLKHPVKGRSALLSEYVEEYIHLPRFAIETDDALVFISKMTNSAMGNIFLAHSVISKEEARRGIVDDSGLDDVKEKPKIIIP